METIKGNYWIKPFSTFMGCTNTTTGECIQNISKEECEKISLNSNTSNVAYHIELPNKKSYCIPLNTFYWKSSNIKKGLISSENPTKLSTNHGIKCTTFYNPKKYDFPKDFNSFIFTGYNVFLRYFDPQEKQYLYLQENFQFSPSQEKALLLTIDDNNSGFNDFILRINQQVEIILFYFETYNVLTYNIEKELFMFQTLSNTSTHFSFYFNKDPYRFINSTTPFKLLLNSLPLYMNSVNRKLTITHTIPDFDFEFLIDKKENVLKFPPYSPDKKNIKLFYKSYESYLCNTYPQSCMPQNTNTFMIFNWTFFSFICVLLLLLLLIIYRKRQSKNKK